jgi:di- and tripeptidase
MEVEPGSRVAFAHFGYIYTLTTIARPNNECWLASGSGDSDIKIWTILPCGHLQLLRTFSELSGAVFSLQVRDSLLYAGLQDGEIDVWDLETGSCIRSIHAHEADVLSMAVLGGDVYTAAGDGRVLRVNEEFDCTAAFKAHSGIVASVVVIPGESGKWDLITAGDDSYVKVCAFESTETRD